MLDEIIKKYNPKLVIELGCFIGYSAVRIARLLEDDAKFYSIEIDPDFVKLAREVIDFAELGDKVSDAVLAKAVNLLVFVMQRDFD